MHIYLVALYDDVKPGTVSPDLQGTSEPNVYVLEAASASYYPTLFDDHPDVWYYNVVHTECIEGIYQILDCENYLLETCADYTEAYAKAVELMFRHYKEFTEC